VVGVTNPKALILFGSAPPQFVNRATADKALQMHLLSLVSGTGLRSSLAISGCAADEVPGATAFAPSIGPGWWSGCDFAGWSRSGSGLVQSDGPAGALLGVVVMAAGGTMQTLSDLPLDLGERSLAWPQAA
jgi:hypothetical protein